MNGKRILILVDCQNDFITGSLANNDANKNKVPRIVEYLKENLDNFDMIYLTQDVHFDNYAETLEGKNLPIVHCQANTDGVNIDKRILEVLNGNEEKVYYVEKTTFGSVDLPNIIVNESTLINDDEDEIVMCGFCTDICVLSNAIILRAQYPNTKITVLKDLCSGSTYKRHVAALESMKSCQINIE